MGRAKWIASEENCKQNVPGFVNFKELMLNFTVLYIGVLKRGFKHLERPCIQSSAPLNRTEVKLKVDKPNSFITQKRRHSQGISKCPCSEDTCKFEMCQDCAIGK
jgi:hypothetical protein